MSSMVAAGEAVVDVRPTSGSWFGVTYREDKPRVQEAIGALVIGDCVTSLGAVPINLDAAGIDIAYSCSQKGLSCPPGLAPFTASPLSFATAAAGGSFDGAGSGTMLGEIEMVSGS